MSFCKIVTILTRKSVNKVKKKKAKYQSGAAQKS